MCWVNCSDRRGSGWMQGALDAAQAACHRLQSTRRSTLKPCGYGLGRGIRRPAYLVPDTRREAKGIYRR
jgi:hypothetical protein